MTRIAPFGRSLYALALIGLGSTHFVFGRFTTGRAPPWPSSLPGGPVWAYLTGAALIAAGLAILARRRGRSAAILAAALVFVWALLRHIPVLTTSAFLSGAWTDAGKALTFVGGSLAVAVTLPWEGGGGRLVTRLVNRDSELVTVGRFCLGPTLILNGAQHFVFTTGVASLIPAWFPGNAVFWTYFGGTALIAGGVGLLIPRTARWAALLSGLMIFSWFFIVHLSREIAGVADGIAVFEALAMAGMLFVIAGVRSPQYLA
jgi:uncharacterized membrane protein